MYIHASKSRHLVTEERVVKLFQGIYLANLKLNMFEIKYKQTDLQQNNEM